MRHSSGRIRRKFQVAACSRSAGRARSTPWSPPDSTTKTKWTVNVNSRMNRNISLTGAYQYNSALSNTDGPGTFPANPYSMEGEYGPAATDIRHRVSLIGTVTARWGVRFNPMLTANSGPPFDVTVGHDVYGDTLFNARPGIATDPGRPGVVQPRTGSSIRIPPPTSDCSRGI